MARRELKSEVAVERWLKDAREKVRQMPEGAGKSMLLRQLGLIANGVDEAETVRNATRH
jgi:hypothetical protein